MLLKPLIDDLVSKAFTKIFNDAFKNFPFEKIFNKWSKGDRNFWDYLRIFFYNKNWILEGQSRFCAAEYMRRWSLDWNWLRNKQEFWLNQSLRPWNDSEAKQSRSWRNNAGEDGNKKLDQSGRKTFFSPNGSKFEMVLSNQPVIECVILRCAVRRIFVFLLFSLANGFYRLFLDL